MLSFQVPRDSLTQVTPRV